MSDILYVVDKLVKQVIGFIELGSFDEWLILIANVI